MKTVIGITDNNFSLFQTIVILVLIVVATLIVRMPFFSVPMISDEGGYAYVAYFWSDDHQLYRDMPFARGQILFLVYKMIFSIFGEDIRDIRLAAAVYNSLTTILLFFLAREIAGFLAGVLSSIIFIVFSTSPGIEGFTANSELFANLPLVASAWFVWKKNGAGLVSFPGWHFCSNQSVYRK